MVIKNPIRNEHREAYKDGKLSEIPADVLALLQAQHGADKSPKKDKEKKAVEEKETE